MPRTDYKLVASEAYYAAIESGATEAEAEQAAITAQLDHMERIIDAADDARAERKLEGR